MAEEQMHELFGDSDSEPEPQQGSEEAGAGGDEAPAAQQAVADLFGSDDEDEEPKQRAAGDEEGYPDR